VEAFRNGGLNPREVPGVLVANHGPFTWGRDAAEAVRHSVILEYVARLDCALRSFHGAQVRPSPHLVEKHFLRKHGKDAYYGQG
jgi:L-ribulose-5-phosphate 4-epimerase